MASKEESSSKLYPEFSRRVAALTEETNKQADAEEHAAPATTLSSRGARPFEAAAPNAQPIAQTERLNR